MLHRFQYHDYTISYQIEGKGTALVLLHGFGESASVYNDQLLALQEIATVIVPDFVGAGNSAMEESLFTDKNINELSTLSFYAQSIKALLQELCIQKCVLLGHSMGGYITLEFAKLYPENLLGFGLLHSTAFADSDEKKQIRQRGIELMENYGGYEFLRTTIPNLFTKQFKEHFPQKVEQLIEEAKQFKTKSLQCYYRAMKSRVDNSAVLSNATVPVLIIAGKQDIVVPEIDLLKQTQLPAVCHFDSLNNAAHMGMLEETNHLNAQIKQFVTYINDL